MEVNKIFYKLNNENIRKFNICKMHQSTTFFIISNLNKISVDEIVRLLKNDRKIIIDDNAIVDINKIYEIKELLNDDLLFNNLLISQEAYIQMWFHEEFANLLFDLEILNKNDSHLIVNSDTFQNMAIKIRHIRQPNDLLKSLDNTIYLKKIIFDSFEKNEINLKDELKKVLEFGNDIKNNLISSSNIYIESLSKKYNVVCNVLDIDNSFYPEIEKTERIGLISTLDFDNKSLSKLDNNDLSYVLYDTKQENNHICWIDAVKIRRYIKKYGINKVVIENIENYDLFPEIKVCTEYSYNKHRTKTFIENANFSNSYALYQKFEGWRTPTLNLTDPNNVPEKLLIFIRELRKILRVRRISIKLNELEIIA